MPSLPPEHERLYSRIYTVVRQIPPGKVATYGQIAAIVGDCTARMVGYAMAACPDDVPWQRVINAQGKVSPRADSWGTEVQRLRLEEEGIVFDADHKVNLATGALVRPRPGVAARKRLHPRRAHHARRRSR